MATEAPEELPLPGIVPKGGWTVGCCDARLTGLRTAHCTVCHSTFTTQSGADRHRTGSHANGTRTCLDPAEMVDKEGRPIFADAGRVYPCWASAGDCPDDISCSRLTTASRAS